MPDTFVEGLTDVFTFVPRGFDDAHSTIVGFIDNRTHYKRSCQGIAFVIDYNDKTIELYFIQMDDDVPELENLDSDALLSGDSFLTLSYDEETWPGVVGNIGTYEAMKASIQHTGGKRRTRRRRTMRRRRA